MAAHLVPGSELGTESRLAAGRWFCRQCGKPINVGYSWEGLCAACAEPCLSRPSSKWWDRVKEELPPEEVPF
jgi:hypothetical protein